MASVALHQIQKRFGATWVVHGTDIGCAAAFLAGEDSRFMTGASMFVDGGMSLG